MTSVLSNLVPMVTNILSSSYNVKIMSKQVHSVRSTNRLDCSNVRKNITETDVISLIEQTVPADTDMDDEAH